MAVAMADAGTSSDDAGRSLDVRGMAWAALLGRWVEFAQASVSFPDDGPGGRWKRSVAPFIEVQAIIWALRELDRLPVPDRPVARDRAEVQVRRAAARLDEAWRGEPMPEAILELLDDATVALREAIYAGLVELVWPGPGVLDMPDLDCGELRGTLAVMPPGSPAMPGEPVAWFAEREPLAIHGCDARPARRPMQVYREIDGAGRAVRDVVAPLEGDIPPGLPMLVALSIAGTPVGRFLHPAETWRAMQRAALAGRETIPVVRLDVDESEPVR